MEDSTFEKGEILTTYRIKFDFDKATIKQESFPFLDSMVTFLNANSNLKLEIQNHSDSRTSDHNSTNLTQKRAKTIYEYLAKMGISKERLIPKGYRDAKLLISNKDIEGLKTKTEKEKAHQMNRRTVFVVTGI